MGTIRQEFTVNKGNKWFYSARSLREQGEQFKKNPQGTRRTRGTSPRKSSGNKEQGITTHEGPKGTRGTTPWKSSGNKGTSGEPLHEETEGTRGNEQN
jgi:hypothetical protein